MYILLKLFPVTASSIIKISIFELKKNPDLNFQYKRNPPRIFLLGFKGLKKISSLCRP